MQRRRPPCDSYAEGVASSVPALFFKDLRQQLDAHVKPADLFMHTKYTVYGRFTPQFVSGSAVSLSEQRLGELFESHGSQALDVKPIDGTTRNRGSGAGRLGDQLVAQRSG
jgi:hypothetical protein